ncbi:MAG: hypothetical protein N838_01840 [Thiohalocapsa sp. PB-PSB1]|jgi:hypothetical protein|nr:MAG: hypothetical protein N838_06795 [Thiohalocapsa sp. PB-PSB1]QQO52312.1 MAG: hypothetical protein N838_01840 [Thiohalocapsa sp. PB-PSB1]
MSALIVDKLELRPDDAAARARSRALTRNETPITADTGNIQLSTVNCPLSTPWCNGADAPLAFLLFVVVLIVVVIAHCG